MRGADYRVASMRLLGASRFAVTFVDGTTGEVDMRGLISGSELVGTTFEPLRDPAHFAQVAVTDGYVSWPCGADLAPDAMYLEIRKKGRWVLR